MSTFNLEPPVLQPNLGIVPPTGVAFTAGCAAIGTTAGGGGGGTNTTGIGQIFPVGNQ